jgi:predicted transcriptional regulator YdeE
MDSFIVRIYRYEENKPHKVVGTVEHVGSEDKQGFTRIDELWEILNAIGQMPKKNQKGANGRRGDAATHNKEKAGRGGE